MNASDGLRARELITSPDAADQEFVLRFAREAPPLYGPWRHLKALYKAAETQGTTELLGTLIGRWDGMDPSGLPRPEQASVTPEIARAWSEGLDISVEGNRACLARRYGFTVLDLSDPGAPQAIGVHNIGHCRRVLLNRNRAFVEVAGARGGRDRLMILDLTDPAQPRDIGQLDIARLKGMAMVDRFLYLLEGVGTQGRKLRVIDVGAAPSVWVTAEMDLFGAEGLAIVGSRAYVSVAANHSRGPGFHVLDLSNPAQPRLLGFWRAASAPSMVGGTILPIQGAARWLYIVDTWSPLPGRQPAAPPPPPPQAPRGLLDRVTGFLRKAVDEATTQVAGVADPEIPHLLVSLSEDRVVRGIVHGTHAYLLLGSGKLEVVDLTGQPRSATSSCYPGTASLLAAVGDRLLAIPPWGLPRTYDLSDPAHPAELGVPPSPETLQYLKRRGRRCLKGLAKTDPARFVETAYHALRSGSAGRSDLEPRDQWVAMDLLYAGSGRYQQTRHGRGPYVARPARTGRRVREERAPQAWDQRPDLALDLFRRADLPWQVHEAMLKILRANRVELPGVTAEQASAFLRSPSAVLQQLGAAALAPAMEAGNFPDAETAARAYFYAPGAVRARLAARLQTRAGSPNWARPFTATLLDLLAAHLGVAPASRRTLDAASLLGRGFAAFAGTDRLLSLSDRLARDGEPALTQLLLAAYRSVGAGSLAAWLQAWGRLPEGVRTRAWEELVAGLRRTTLKRDEITALALNPDHSVRWVAWHLLAGLKPAGPLVAEVWKAVLAAGPDSPVLRTVLASAAALGLLRDSGADLGVLGDRLLQVPSLTASLSPQSLEPLAAVLPAASLMTLIGSFSDAAWADLKEAVLSGIRASGRLAQFWKAVPSILDGGAAQRRILDDDGFVASFLEITDASILELGDGPLEPLLLHWLTVRGDLLLPGSSALLAAATHPLPSIRDRGLARLREYPLELGLALRLLESGVPAAMAVGREFFAAVAPGSAEELTALLALCDSPERDVRAIGRELIQAHPEALSNELINALAEHADPEMNRFLADLLGRIETPVATEAVRDFDRGVLRSQNRARRAKESVKSRLDRAAAVDPAVLLEMARGNTLRDAEWALAQLARMAAEGQSVEGVAVEGAAGV